MRFHLLLLGALAALVSLELKAEDGVCDRIAIQQGRPSVGLALSGGGARGAAHIGVLKVLEENHIPVDCVAGTSMGAVVGGLLAAGLTPEQIEEQMLTIDWGDMFRDRVPRELRSFERKKEDGLSLINFKPGISMDGIQLPTGVVHGQKIEKLLTDLTLPISRYDSFDDLYLPFRAVGTDLVTGDAVVFSDGSLGTAIRASMAIPGVFSPVRHQQHLVVDGGMAMNLPVSVVKEMGADIVIAVDISTPLLNAKQLSNVFSVAEQLTGFLTIRNTVEQRERLTSQDLLVVPNLESIGSADFDRAEEAIAAGVEAAQQQLAALTKLAIGPAKHAALDQQFAGAPAPPRLVDFVIIEHDTVLNDEYLMRRISIEAGEPVDPQTITDSINNLYGLELFQTVSYKVVDTDRGVGVVITATERSWGPNYIQAGLEVGGGLDDKIDFTFGGSLLFTQLNAWNAEARVGLAIGETPRLYGEWHQPLGNTGGFYVDGVLDFTERTLSVFDGSLAAFEYQLDEARAVGRFGYRFDNWGDLRLAYRYGSGNLAIRTGPDIPPADFKRGELVLGFTADTLNERFFPTSGSYLDARYLVSREGLGADTDFDQLTLFGQHAFPMREYAVVPYIDYRSTVSGMADVQNLFSAGGLFRLSGLQANQFYGQNFAMVGAVAFREWHTPFLSAYLGGSLEYGNVFETEDDIDIGDGIFAGSLFAGASTGIGPVYVAYGRTENGEDAVYFYVGNLFDR